MCWGRGDLAYDLGSYKASDDVAGDLEEQVDE